MSELRGNNPKVSLTDGKTIGCDEGDTCNLLIDDGEHGPYMCDGTMELEEGKDCSCHLSAPCGYCIDRQIVCSDCGQYVTDEV